MKLHQKDLYTNKETMSSFSEPKYFIFEGIYLKVYKYTKFCIGMVYNKN